MGNFNMSMNLYCTTKGKVKVDLYQTPTWLTHLALYDYRRKKRTPKETRHIYACWLWSTLNGVHDDEKVYEENLKKIHAHLDSLERLEYMKWYEL
jgi:hypothetical protein